MRSRVEYLSGPGAAPIRHVVRHAIVTTIGRTDPPADATRVRNADEAIRDRWSADHSPTASTARRACPASSPARAAPARRPRRRLRRTAGSRHRALPSAMALLAGHWRMHRPRGSDTPQPTFSGLQAVRAADLPALAVGRFAAGPGLPRRPRRRCVIRAAALRPPEGIELRRLILARPCAPALASAGRLEPASALRVSGLLTENRVDFGLRPWPGRAGRGVHRHARQAARPGARRCGSSGIWDSSSVHRRRSPISARTRFTARSTRCSSKPSSPIPISAGRFGPPPDSLAPALASPRRPRPFAPP